MLDIYLTYKLSGSLGKKHRSQWWCGFPYLLGIGCGILLAAGEENAGGGGYLIGWIVGMIIAATRPALPKLGTSAIADPQRQLQQEMERVTTPTKRAEGIELEPLPPAAPKLAEPPVDAARQ